MASVVFVSLLAGIVGTLISSLEARAGTARADLLAGGADLIRAQEQEATLYPAWPANIRAMEAWIESVKRLPDHLERVSLRLFDFVDQLSRDSVAAVVG